MVGPFVESMPGWQFLIQAEALSEERSLQRAFLEVAGKCSSLLPPTLKNSGHTLSRAERLAITRSARKLTRISDVLKAMYAEGNSQGIPKA